MKQLSSSQGVFSLSLQWGGKEASGHMVLFQIDPKIQLFRFGDPTHGFYEYDSLDEMIKEFNDLWCWDKASMEFNIRQIFPKDNPEDLSAA